jgi:predicted anti-sigma-YlaC factor YlaD
MTCEEFQCRLSALVDKELPRWTRWKVETHLGHCEECRARFQELRAIDAGILLASEATRVPDFTTAAVMFRLPAMPAAKPRSLRYWAVGIGLAGIQAMALVGTWWWGFHSGAGGVRDRRSGQPVARLGAPGFANSARSRVRVSVMPLALPGGPAAAVPSLGVWSGAGSVGSIPISVSYGTQTTKTTRSTQRSPRAVNRRSNGTGSRETANQ